MSSPILLNPIVIALPERVRSAIRHGANVNPSRPGKHTPLHLACIQEAVETIHMLIDAGADLRAKADGPYTPLLYCCRYNLPKAAAALIAAGDDITQQLESLHLTPIKLAAMNGHVECVRVLCEAGADVYSLYEGRVAMIQTARSKGYSETVEFVEGWRRVLEMDNELASSGVSTMNPAL